MGIVAGGEGTPPPEMLARRRFLETECRRPILAADAPERVDIQVTPACE
jgi:hypothetical protein